MKTSARESDGLRAAATTSPRVWRLGSSRMLVLADERDIEQKGNGLRRGVPFGAAYPGS